ncbi:hypothetical protein PsYK624_123260 [Phanerochaete sordida]|uniref:Uncharacterized protein n=1 Tax=Phanerochaete sordida TaxID=48140 RepID=A0A9P3LIG4_9APHY|nr:hypothetical protein PsYK624_123260 [Phanerochaete sordida]
MLPWVTGQAAPPGDRRLHCARGDEFLEREQVISIFKSRRALDRQMSNAQGRHSYPCASRVDALRRSDGEHKSAPHECRHRPCALREMYLAAGSISRWSLHAKAPTRIASPRHRLVARV